MTSEQVAASYDRLADQWLDVSAYGFAQVERAIAFVENKGVALDMGWCSSKRPSQSLRACHPSEARAARRF